jgi:site-specific DNA recombinase
MFLKIIGIFAEFERENLVTRLKLGFERKVKEGYTLANYSISYGYSKKAGQKIQSIQPDEARIVENIFDLYVNKNYSMGQIAKNLNERKIKTKRSGYSWDTSSIRYLLTNPTYIGKVRYSTLDKEKYFEIKGHHEPIISEKLYNEAQEKIKSMPQLHKTKRPKEDNYFCGILTCGLCGAKFTTHTHFSKTDENGAKYTKSSYRCNNKKYSSQEKACKCSDVIHEKVEKVFSEYIEKINSFSEIENADIKNKKDTDIKRQKELEYTENLHSKINNISKRKQEILEQYVNGEMKFAEYREVLSVLNEKYENTERELKNIQPAEQPKEEIAKDDIILNLKENWAYLNKSERMMFLQKFIKRIVITVKKERRNSSIPVIETVEFK